MNPNTLPIGARVAAEVRAEMARQGVTRAMLSAATDIPSYTLSRRLAGSTDLTISELVEIAAALRIPASDIIERASAVAA